MVVTGVSPTRLALLRTNKRIELAKRGHKLLKEKRDALIMEFFSIIRKAKKLRDEVESEILEIYEMFAKACAYSGSIKINTVANSVKMSYELKIYERNIMGVKVPLIEFKEKEFNYDFLASNKLLDEIIARFRGIMKKIIELAELEATILKLAEEIQKTKRRVNALEYVIIPRLEEIRKYIQLKLGEMERENFFRLKIIKRKLKKKELQ